MALFGRFVNQADERQATICISSWNTAGKFCRSTRRNRHLKSLARYREAMEQQNCMFRKIEILPHNIGYLKLDFFPDTSVCRSTATAAMAALNHAAAVIIDLRDNSGGFPNMVMLIASYLFRPSGVHV